MFKLPRTVVKHNPLIRCGVFLANLMFMLLCVPAYASDIQLTEFTQGALGKNIQYFQEQDEKLTLSQAKGRFASGQVSTGKSQSISLGIGVKPAWLMFTVDNNTSAEQLYRLSIETPWLDYIDTWLLRNGSIERHISGGDGYPFEQRPMQYRFYAFDHNYKAGKTDVIIRVETLGPMAIPVQFSTQEKANSRDVSQAYQYGLLYGIMSALALYNLVLFLFIRQAEYGLYGLYLIGFVLNSLSYTGQLHAIYTPDYGPYFQDWTDIFLMITYSVAGLHFARTLLRTSEYAPRLAQFTRNITIIFPAGMVVGFIIDQLLLSMALAFILNCGFVTLFIAMGYYAYKVQRPFAVIFLFSSVTAAICITISTLAVAGLLVPYNDYTFKLIEVGMAFEAILLAVILARQFRMAKLDKMIAERYATTDFLTRINNRRGFQEQLQHHWQHIKREKRDATMVILDIDGFKQINDEYGHDNGDKVLVAVAKAITDTIRKGDVAARWGGEEFVVFLPETDIGHGQLLAERIRKSISDLTLHFETKDLTLTASLGVAGSKNNQVNSVTLADVTFEQLINEADKALYSAKMAGKNKVHISAA